MQPPETICQNCVKVAMLPEPMVLSDEFHRVLDLLEHSDRNLFVTGRAGTGKSTLLHLFKKTTSKKTVILAPTGIAALNVQGQTIHSFFGFPPRIIPHEELTKRKNHKLYKAMEVMIIDEISMVRADMMDAIDVFLRNNRENKKPFGGVQVLLFGDLFQLPPVVASIEERSFLEAQYPSVYFFDSRVMQTFDYELVELRKVYRQDERHFIRLLDAIRLNRMDDDDLADLNEVYQPRFESEDFYITLSPRNQLVDKLNQVALANLDGSIHQFTATVFGQFNPSQYPTDLMIQLKVGAQVMMIRNDPEKKYVNGTLGKVLEVANEAIKVEVDYNGSTNIIDVARSSWEVVQYKFDEENPGRLKSEVVGSFAQFPIKLAWAITIHKSQGKTFDKVIIDMGQGAFEHGQSYVALSRCRTLKGIILKQRIRFQDIIVDEKIVSYYLNKR